MLDDFKNKIAVLEQFDIERETMNIINENAKVIEDLLQDQLKQGRDKNNNAVTLRRTQGGKIGVFDYYSDRTIWEKEHHGTGLGAVTDFVTNYMTGSFYREMFVKTRETTFEVESAVPYFQKIIKQSGGDIMELNDENLAYFAENILAPQLQLKFSILWNGI